MVHRLLNRMETSQTVRLKRAERLNSRIVSTLQNSSILKMVKNSLRSLMMGKVLQRVPPN